MNKSALTILICVLLSPLCSYSGERQHFYTLNTQQGLSDNNVLQLLELQDGRLAVRTERGLNVYDGQSFHFIPLTIQDAQDIPLYGGDTHIYEDYKDRIWIKRLRKVLCVDLRRFKKDSHSLERLVEGTKAADIKDMFVDCNHDLWCVVGKNSGKGADKEIINVRTKTRLSLDSRWGELQDIEADKGHVYTFHATGIVASFSLQTQKLEYTKVAYGKEDAAVYYEKSLVVKSDGGQFYQKREGCGQTVILHFDPATRLYEKVYNYDGILHSMIMFSEDRLLVSYSKGYLLFDFSKDGAKPECINDLFLPDGTSLTIGVNTIRKDAAGGLWLGTYNKGLLYTSPLLGLFNTKPLDVPIFPILKNIYLNGKPIEQDKEYGGRVLLTESVPYADSLSLCWSQNDIAFHFCTMNYIMPRGTCYRYRLNGEPWHYVTADSTGKMVDDKGTLYLSFLDLAPGEYRLDVVATANPAQWKGRMKTIRFFVAAPWWTSWWALVLYVVAAVAVVVVASIVYMHNRRRRNAQRKREEALMMRIRELLNKTGNREKGSDVVLSESEADKTESQQMTPRDMEFIRRATALVEENMANGQYNVETLSSDLCMERTGLYKKLTVLLEQSPVTFIRTIRLRRAAAMLSEGNLSVAEISEQTGFSSPSYFSKCFQKEYGCKPSEYSSRMKEQE